MIQNQATQFDGPFFRYIAQQRQFLLKVHYTKPKSALKPFDPELRRHIEWDNDAVSGYDSTVYPSGRFARIANSLKIIRNRPDLIILAGFRSFDHFLLLVLAVLHGIPAGFRADTCVIGCPRPTMKRRLKSALLRLVMKMFSTGHPVGSLAEAHMVEHGVDPRRIFRFPYLVDSDALSEIYRESLTRKPALLSSYGIASGDFVVLGVMKFVEREDPLTLLRAYLYFAKAVSQLGRKAHLILVGDGALRPEIEEEAKQELGVTVHLPGYVSYKKLPEFFALASVLVHSARGEPWGVTVQEALVCGLPVIAADSVGSAKDLIRSGTSGFTFPAGNWLELASLLQRLYNTPEFLSKMQAECAHSEALVPFTYPFVCGQLNRALEFVST